MKKNNTGFSLIEIVVVVTILAIIAAVTTNGVSMHKKAALIAKTRIQFLQYESAIRSYCREYGDLPLFFDHENLISLNNHETCSTFIKVLSGKTPLKEKLSQSDQDALNPKSKTFHVFHDDEFFINADGTIDYAQLADGFNNPNIFIIVEDPFDEDAIISKEKLPPEAQKMIQSDGIRNSIAIFSISEKDHLVISNCF